LGFLHEQQGRNLQKCYENPLSGLRDDAAPLHCFDLVSPPGMEQQGLRCCAKGTHRDLAPGKSQIFELASGCQADVQAIAAWFGIASQATTGFKVLDSPG
jgi:hypothetical protein